MIKVYRIEFEDGAQYVGQTVRPMRRRLQHHMASPCNKQLSERLWRSNYSVRVLSRHYKQARADRAEIREIKRLTKPLNFRGVKARLARGRPPVGPSAIRPMPRAGRWRERTTKDTKCSVCRKVKPADKFYTDRSRFNGLESRCSACANALKRAVRRARCAGHDVSIAYAAEKDALRPAGDRVAARLGPLAP